MDLLYGSEVSRVFSSDDDAVREISGGTGDDMIDNTVPDEIAKDPYKLCLYKKAIRRGKERERTLRINIIGNYNQGKTSLAKRLIGESCEGVRTTNGIEINRYRCNMSEDGTQILTTTDFEKHDYASRIATVARSMKAVIDIKDDYDYSNEDTIHTDSEEIVNPKSDTTEKVSEPSIYHKDTKTPTNPHATRHQNKVVKPVQLQTQDENTKKRNVDIPTEEFAEFSNLLEEQDDKLPIFLDIWDFGGQYIFYATHTLFHSRTALYLFVFDLSSPLDKIVRDEEFPRETGDRNLEYFARFWMESIHAYLGPGPQVVLVGTHKDMLKGNDQIIKDYFERLRCLFDNTKLIHHIQREGFAVDNHNDTDTGIKKLLEFIVKKYHQLAHSVEVPTRWILLEKALKGLRPKKIITFQEVMEIDKGNEYSLEEDQIKLFLQYHHDKGSLLYFDEDELSDFIVLDPRYLINAFKCIITSEHFCKNDPVIRQFWQSLTEQGKLTNNLIDTVWSNDTEGFTEHRDVLLKFLTKYNIISRVVEHDVNTGSCQKSDWYIVPSLLKAHATTDEMGKFLKGKTQTNIRYVMRFEKSAIVHMVYHKLLAAALGKWPVVTFIGKMLLFENMTVFSLIKKHAGMIELRQSIGTIELTVINLQPFPVECDPTDQFRRFVEHNVAQEFRKSRRYDEQTHVPYTRAYRCNNRSHGPHADGSRELSEFKEDEDVTCPDNVTHEQLYFAKGTTEWFPTNISDEYYPKIQLTDKNLSTLAQEAFGRNWTFLGTELDIPRTKLEQIQLDNPTTATKIYSMLLEWKAREANEATLAVLVDAVRKCPAVSINWNTLRHLRDELCKDIVFIQKLSNKNIKVSETLILECEITNPDVPVVWQKDNTYISPNDDRVTMCSQEGHHQLRVEDVAVNDAGKYKCICGNTSTECFVKCEDKDEPLEIIKNLSDIEIADTPCTAIFACELNRETHVKWYFKGQHVPLSSKHTIINEGCIHRLLITDVSESDEGKYMIVSGGKRSSAALYIKDTEEEKNLLMEHYKQNHTEAESHLDFIAEENILEKEELIQLLRQVRHCEPQDQKTKFEVVFDLTITVSGSTAEKTKLYNDRILDSVRHVLQSSNRRKPSTSTLVLTAEMETLVDALVKIPGVKISLADDTALIMKISVASYDGLNGFLTLMNGKVLRQKLFQLRKCVEKDIEESVVVDARITSGSFINAKKQLSTTNILNDKHGDFKCKNHHWMQNAWYCIKHDEFCCTTCKANEHRKCEGIKKVISEKTERKVEESLLTVKEMKKCNVRIGGIIKRDQIKCYISGICVLPDHEILLVDSYNKRLKKLDSSLKLVSYCDLPGYPYDMCYIGNDVAVVSAPFSGCLQFVDVSGKMQLKHAVPLTFPCRRLACHGDTLYVTDGGSVYTCKTDGTQLQLLYKDERYNGIAVSDDGERIYLTGTNGPLVTIDNEGNDLSTMRTDELFKFKSVCTVGDGTVLLYDWGKNRVVQVDYDGKRVLGTVVPKTDSLRDLHSLCFDRQHCRLIVGHYNHDNILVFQLKWKWFQIP